MTTEHQTQTGGPPPRDPAPHTDPLLASLREIDRRLHELEAETMARSAPPVAPPPSAPGGVDELARLRDDLARIGQSLIAAYDTALRRIQQVEAQMAALTQPRVPVHDAPRLPAATAAQTVSSALAALVQPQQAPAPEHQPAPAAAGAPELERSLSPQALARWLAWHFEGTIRISVGPLPDVSAIGALEQALAGIEDVIRVSVRGFTDRHAVIEVVLGRGVRLIPELQRTLPVAFEVIRVDPTELVLATTAEAASRSPASEPGR